jgi:MATE family multidrug resistance protein
LNLENTEHERAASDASHAHALREVLSMALPMIVAMASSTMMHFVDSWMVSRVGTEEIAAVAPAGAWVFILISFLIGVLSCTSTFVGQSFGAGHYRDCARYAWQGVYISLVAGGLATLLWPAAPALFAAVGHGAQVQEREVIYFQIRLFSISGLTMSVALGSFFQAVSRPRIPMVVVILANLINGGLDYILIFGKLGFEPMGIRGAAIATVIASSLQGLTMLLVFVAPPFNKRFGSLVAARWDWHRMKQLFNIGWAAGVNFSLDVASWSVFTNFLVGRLGKVPLAASNIAAQIMHLSFMPTVGLSMAITALVGQWIGRKEVAAAKRRTYIALRLAMAYMFTMGVLFFVFRRQLISFFRNDPEVVAIGSKVLIVAAVFQIFDAISIVTSGALKGAGDTRWVAMFTVSYAWLVFLPMSYLMAFRLDFGAVGAWTGVALYIFCLSMTLLWRFHSERWRRIDIFGGDAVVPAPQQELVDR